MKKRRKKIKIIPLLLLFFVVFFLTYSINNLLNKTFKEKLLSNSIPNLNNNTNNSINRITNRINESQIKETEDIQKNKKLSEKNSVNKTCTWKKVKAPISVKKKFINTTTIKQNITQTYSYSFKIKETPINKVKISIKNKEYSGLTFYNYNYFKDFYKNIYINSWIEETGLVNYTSTNSDMAFTLINPTAIEGSYDIFLLDFSNKDQEIDLETLNKKTINLKAKASEKIVLKNAVKCYHLKNNNLTLMEHYSKFLKKYRLENQDFIVFNYSQEFFACVRPYIIIIPETYQKTITIEKKIEREYYKTVIENITKIVCS